MKRIALTFGVALTLLGGATALAVLPEEPIGASDGPSHTLFVNGTPYEYTQESGSAIHFETGPVTADAAVTFPERGQEWNGVNGATKLPCPGGVHWISNESVLTLSHCLGEPTTDPTIPPPPPPPPPCPDCTPVTVQVTTPSTVPGDTTTTTDPGETTTTTDPGGTTTTTDPASVATTTPPAKLPATL